MAIADGGLRAKAETWDALPRLWGDLFGSPGLCSFVVFEDDEVEREADDVELCGFAMSAFVNDAFFREARSRREPWLAATLYERLQQGTRVILGADEVRQGNTDGTLHLLVLHAVHRHPDFAHPETRRLMPVAAQSFHFAHAGYRLASITGEVYGAEIAAFMLHGGYVQLSDFAEHEEASRSPRRPFLFALDRERVQRGATNATSLEMFHPEPPLFFFTPAEQRVLLHALTGMPDRQIAAALDVSQETVRSTWDSIYTRVARARPRLLHSVDGEPSPVARGAEKRRQLLDYLRQHMEELRPITRPR